MKMTTEVRELKKVLENITGNLRNAVASAIKAGGLLTKIKTSTKYGDWEEVLESVELTYKTAQRYMTVWEHRSQLNLNEIKTISDAENCIATFGRIPQPTSQNEPLTQEKTSDSHGPVRDTKLAHNRQETEIKGKETAVHSGLRPDAIPRDNSRAYLSDADPADKIAPSTPADSAVAAAVVEGAPPEFFPKVISFEVHNLSEEYLLRKYYDEKIVVKRGSKKSVAKFDIHDAIAKVCSAYKRVMNTKLSVKPQDAAQLRRLLESGIELTEFIEVGEKAWKSKSFLSQYSHQLAMFVKHYGNIRNEIENENNGKPSRPGVDRNAGTANAKTIGQYDGVGKVV